MNESAQNLSKQMKSSLLCVSTSVSLPINSLVGSLDFLELFLLLPPVTRFHSIFEGLVRNSTNQKMFNGLVIEPTEIKFAAPYTRTVPVQLRLENSTADQVIAFKVKTVDPRRYTVKPSNGVIAPQGSANLTVELQPLADDAAIDQFVKTKQKFMIQSVSSSVESASQSVATMFASAGRIVETKLLCVFEGQTQANIEKSNSYMPAKSNAPEDDLNESLVSTLSSTGGTAESTASAVQGTPQVSSFAKPAPVSVSVSKDQSDLIIALLVIIIVMIALILAFK